jgi:hypothetical protein
MTPDVQALTLQAGSVFTPGAPIQEMDLFAGRRKQVERVIEAISQRGCHAILYGEQGVGKTSLSNMISGFLAGRRAFVVSRTNCDLSDSFSSLWTRALKDIEAARGQQIGLSGRRLAPAEAHAGEPMAPDSIRRILQEISATAALVIVFDEFDRIKNSEVVMAMTDMIKALSDNSINATILIIGVGDSVNELIHEPRPIERALVQVPIPKMPDDEIRDFIDKGLSRLAMGIDSTAREHLVLLSQGVPYIAHLLCFYISRAALEIGHKTVSLSLVEEGMNRALDQWQQSIKTLYNEAIQSQQSGHVYKEVLLACALADVDELGYFSAAGIKKPLSWITNRNFETAKYKRQLRDLCEPLRGSVLQRIGESYRLRYRISNPILRPYIIMRGINDKVITKAQLSEWKSASHKPVGESRIPAPLKTDCPEGNCVMIEHSVADKGPRLFSSRPVPLASWKRV